MKSIIIYGSEYGTAEKYASKLSEMTAIPAKGYKEISDLSEYDRIIHFGGLYAGGVLGLKNTVKSIKDGAELIIVTVGLADVNDKENTDNIKKSIARQVPEKLLNSASVFHLRGSIDYSRLNFKHKTMMTLLYKAVKNRPEEQKTAEDRAMIETFGKRVDFVDYDSLKPIAERLMRGIL